MEMFRLDGQVAVVTGGYGVLGGKITDGLLAAGANAVIIGRNREAAEERVAAFRNKYPTRTISAQIADVTNEQELRDAAKQIVDEYGKVDILINCAGGNVARSRSDTVSVFDLPLDSFDEVVRLNLHGTVYPSMVFGDAMATHGTGSIVNISSMASQQAISGVMGYSAAKAGVDNFTRWLAVDAARKFGDGIRVNSIAPGFFITKQNKNVLMDPDGSYSDRSTSIVSMTPMGRFGKPEELVGTVIWLCSSAASFVTGSVIPVDGGFSAFSGV